MSIEQLLRHRKLLRQAINDADEPLATELRHLLSALPPLPEDPGPFTAEICGRRITLVSPHEVDWQAGSLTDSYKLLVSPDDRAYISEAWFSVWQWRLVFDAYAEHHGLRGRP